jgi:hypothetical protein
MGQPARRKRLICRIADEKFAARYCRIGSLRLVARQDCTGTGREMFEGMGG